jgi:hypothetical protein
MKIRYGNRFISGTALLLAVFALFSLCSTIAVAHGPKEVKLAYDASSQTLQVAIAHSPFSANHYIEKVEMKKNGKAATIQDYKGQSSETFTYIGKVAAAPGDVLEVKVSCSRFGSKTETLTVGPAAAK